MRSASETVREIRHLFETGDLSCTAMFRQLAREYAAAAADLAKDLKQCREILRCGTPADALEFNRRFSPTLSERAARLEFPEREQWVNLCREYHADEPAAPDRELLALLASGTVRTAAEGSRDLLQSWRRMARGGSPEEKLALLRQLIAAEPENPVWRKNLQYAENAWVHDRLQAAAAAFQEHRDEDLAGIYQTCLTAPLQTPVPSSAFAPYMEPIRRCRRKQLAGQLKEQLEKVNNACSMGDADALQQALEKWEKLAAEPDAEPEKNSDMQIAAARRFLSEKIAERTRLQTMKELQNTLTMQLDEAADFSSLDRTFHRLEALDPAAVPETLAARFRQAEQNFTEECRRRHIRITVFGILLAGLLTAGCIALTRILQFQRECAKVCASLDAMQKQDAPETVLKEIERLDRTSPKIAAAATVRARKIQAEVRIRQQREDTMQFDRLLKNAQSDCNESRAESQTAEQSFRMLKESRLFRTAEQQTAMTELLRRRLEIQTLLQDRRDQEFVRECRRISRQLNAVMTQLEDELSETVPELAQTISGLAGSLQRLAGARVRQEYAGTLPELEKQLKLVQERFAEVQSFRKLYRRLTRPQNFIDFQMALQETGKHPKIAAAFAAAGRQFAEPDRRLSGTPDAADAARLAYQLSAADCRTALQTLRQKIRKMPELYVLTLHTKDGIWNFYTKNPAVQLERAHGGLGGRMVSMTLTLALPEGKTAKILFRIRPAADGLQLETVSGGKLYSEGLPGAFLPVPAAALNRLAKNGLPHLDDLRHLLELLPEPEGKLMPGELDRMLENALQKIMQDTEIPPARKLCLTSELLNLYGTLSAVNREIAAVLNINPAFTAPDAGTAPTLQPVLATEMARLRKDFAAVGNTKQLFRECMAKAPVPVGVLYLQQGNAVLRGFEKLPEKIWIAFTRTASGKNFYVEVEKRLFEGSGMPEKAIPPVLRKDFFHGKIVFAPAENLPSLPPELRSSLLPHPAVLDPVTAWQELVK